MKTDTRTLTDLGFSNLEADIYYYLVQSAPVTGYHVARALGKPTANTYQAVESLRRKGAIEVDESGDRLCRAVPPQEFFNTLEREFTAKRMRAERALAGIKAPSADEGIFALQTRAMVLERAHAMIRNSQAIALIDLSPGFVSEFRPTIAETARAGTLVAAKLYQSDRLPRAKVVVDPDGARVMKDWKGDWLNIIADGREFLASFFPSGHEEPAMAYWSPNNLLAWTYHSSLAAEIVLTSLAEEAAAAPTAPSRLDFQRARKLMDRLSAKSAPGATGLSKKLNVAADTHLQPAAPKKSRKR